MRDAAKELGWSKSKYSRFESPKHGISVNDFFQVAQLFEAGVFALAGVMTRPQAEVHSDLGELRRSVEEIGDTVSGIMRKVKPK